MGRPQLADGRGALVCGLHSPGAQGGPFLSPCVMGPCPFSGYAPPSDLFSIATDKETDSEVKSLARPCLACRF